MKGIFFAPGFEEVEALTVVDILRRAGKEVCMISVDNTDTVTGSHGIEVKMDAKLSEIDFDRLDTIILPGGAPGFKNLEKCALLKEKTVSFAKDEKKTVAAICGAPSVLGHWDVLVGHKACVYPGMESELKGAEVLYDSAVISDNIITSRGMGTAIDFGLAIVAYEDGNAVADSLAQKIVYKR